MYRTTAILLLVTQILLLLGGSIVIAEFSWQPCDDLPADQTFAVHHVSISPDPVSKSQPMRLVIEAATPVDVDNGKMEVSVLVFGWKVYTTTEELCGSTACPLRRGDKFSIANSHSLPSIAPAGSYHMQARAKGPAGQELMCIDLHFQVASYGAAKAEQ